MEDADCVMRTRYFQLSELCTYSVSRTITIINEILSGLGSHLAAIPACCIRTCIHSTITRSWKTGWLGQGLRNCIQKRPMMRKRAFVNLLYSCISSTDCNIHFEYSLYEAICETANTSSVFPPAHHPNSSDPYPYTNSNLHTFKRFLFNRFIVILDFVVLFLILHWSGFELVFSSTNLTTVAFQLRKRSGFWFVDILQHTTIITVFHWLTYLTSPCMQISCLHRHIVCVQTNAQPVIRTRST